MTEFRMPSLGADMEAGTLVEWLVGEGDEVHRGDIVAVVETEKSTIEVEIFSDGRIEQLLVGPGTKVPVGTALATVSEPVTAQASPRTGVGERATRSRDEGEAQTGRDGAEPSTGATGPAPPVEPAVTSPLVRHLADVRHVDIDTLVGSGPGGRVRRADVELAAGKGRGQRADGNGQGRLRVTPRARRRAAALGVDPASVPGSGPDGAVVTADVERAAASTAVSAAFVSRQTATPERAPVEERPASAKPHGSDGRTSDMRRAIARLMDRANREIPHFYLADEVDLQRALTWLTGQNARRPISRRILPAALLLKASALAAAEVDGVNGHWVDGGFRPAERVDLGVAISLRTGGLVTPVIPDAAALSLDDIMQALQGLVKRTRAGRLRGSDLAEGSVTVTNLGDQGAAVVYGVVHPPQVALIGFGAVSERPWVRDGMVGVRPGVTITVAADHRAVDGRVGSALIAAVERHLQEPEGL